MAQEVDPNAAGLVGYWNFEEPLGEQTVTDLGPYGYHGQLGTNAFMDNADPARVPAPSSVALLAMAAFGLICDWRRRRAA